MKRVLIIFVVGVALVIAASAVPVRGRKLLGFDYRATVDTSLSVCPDRVIAQSGNEITLASGERFVVRDVSPVILTDALREADAMVKVDRQHGFLAIRKRLIGCGFRPSSDQRFTVPLFATEHIDSHHAAEFAPVEGVTLPPGS